jgi:hypothetical protein
MTTSDLADHLLVCIEGSIVLARLYERPTLSEARTRTVPTMPKQVSRSLRITSGLAHQDRTGAARRDSSPTLPQQILSVLQTRRQAAYSPTESMLNICTATCPILRMFMRSRADSDSVVVSIRLLLEDPIALAPSRRRPARFLQLSFRF